AKAFGQTSAPTSGGIRDEASPYPRSTTISAAPLTSKAPSKDSSCPRKRPTEPAKGELRRPRGASGQWIPSGETVQVAGTIIEGGMLYVGRFLTSVGSPHTKEPALIDPSLRVASSYVGLHDVGMPY